MKAIELALVGLGAALIAASVHANDRQVPVAELKPPSVQPASQVRSVPEIKPVVAPARSVETLSPGNQLIARALYNAQKAVTVTGLQAWSLERVASSRAGGRNWGEVFQQMKQEGLLEAETLGQVVTWYQYHQATAPGSATLTGVTVVTPKSAP